MKRTVREDRGAWSLLKNAAVRASDTASSSLSTMLPKFPTVRDPRGALLAKKVSSTAPVRSTTAITSAEFTELAACLTTVCTSSAVSWESTVAGGGAPVLLAPPPHAINRKASVISDASTTIAKPRRNAGLPLTGLCEGTKGKSRGGYYTGPVKLARMNYARVLGRGLSRVARGRTAGPCHDRGAVGC